MTSVRGLRTLVVAQDFPWPATIGSHLRLAQVIGAAESVGQVDLFAIVPAKRTEPCLLPFNLTVRRLKTVVRPVPHWTLPRRSTWMLFSKFPLEVEEAIAPGLGDELRSWADAEYDAVWVSKPATFEVLGRPDLGPTIVDLDDLEDLKIEGRLRATVSGGPRVKRRSPGTVAAVLQAKLNARRWRELQLSVARSVERVVLCSELDAERASMSNCAVVPNAYMEPQAPLGRVEPRTPPTLMFAGSHRYGPNADGAVWFVSDVWPDVLARLPEARLRLVGEPVDSTTRLGGRPGVVVAGTVASMEPELERTDVVVVPLRYGSGTRVKIIEAFAQRIPVVSTTVGAEGLGAIPGTHLLVADEPAEFADACVRLVQDLELRRRLVDAAQALFLERFRWSVAEARIRDLLEEVATRGRTGYRSNDPRTGVHPSAESRT